MLRAFFPRAVAALALGVSLLGCSRSDHPTGTESVARANEALGSAGEAGDTSTGGSGGSSGSSGGSVGDAGDAGAPGGSGGSGGAPCTQDADCGDRCGVCTTGVCSVAPASTVCKPSKGICDQDDFCDGTNKDCPTADLKFDSSKVCLAKSDLCDLDDVCDGINVDCVGDKKVAPNTLCRAANGVCDVDDFCDGSHKECTDGKAPTATLCLAQNGLCDLPDFCDGVQNSCPGDKKVAVNTLCRAANGVCDADDFCDGTNKGCPDNKAPTTKVCLPASGICDADDFCDNVHNDCQTDNKAPTSKQCLAVQGPCDVADFCDGVLKTCPGDKKKDLGTVCLAKAGVCDVDDTCDGMTDACADKYLPGSTKCKEAMGDCDEPEFCTGASPACPPDVYSPNTKMCRDIIQPKCDTPEYCTGGSITCPPNSYATKGTACDDTFACTETDACDGNGVCAGVPATDPAKLETYCHTSQHLCGFVFCAVGRGCDFNPAAKTKVCRPAAGTCDVPESCDGTNQDCPPEVVKTAGVECQGLACSDSVLKPQILCNGADAKCPTIAAGSCGNFACGSPTECRTTCINSDDCGPAFYCLNNDCVPRIGAGQACQVDAECSNSNPHCVDGVCCDTTCVGQCEACNLTGKRGTCTGVTDKPVAPRPQCTADGTKCDGFCDPSNRTACQFPNKATSCRDASCDTKANSAQAESFCTGKGTCALTASVVCEPYLCNGPACAGNCTADAQCAKDAYCQAGKCTPKGDLAEKCTTDKQCGSGHCADGVCCDTACTGQCEACNQVPGAKAGTCSPVSGDPLGKRSACAASDAACGGSCDGKDRLSCIYPAQGKVCRPGACADGIATVNATCDGHGACPAVVSVTCKKGCEASVCAGDECVTDPDCNDAGKYCAAGVCLLKGAPGSACSVATACQSGFCTDGVCCDSACLGQCEACDASGSMGTCSAVPKGDSPHGGRTACASDGSSCGGVCDGSERASCAYSTAVCRAGSCVAGATADDSATSIVQASCDGRGSCPAEQQQLCGADGCDAKGALCDGGCAANKSACKGSEYCSAGECVPRLPPASTCGTDTQCASGFCVDGVCCDQRCGDQCAACDVPSSVGTCTPVVGGAHGGRAACGGVGTCGAACNGLTTASCTFPDDTVSCGEAFCGAGVHGAAPLCDGKGVCAPAVISACKSYTCDGSDCGTACVHNTDCVKQLECREGQCVPPLLIDGVDKGSCGCSVPGSSSHTPKGVLFLLGLCAAFALRRRRHAA